MRERQVDMKLTPARTPRAGGRMTALPFLIVALAISEVATAPAAPPIADFPVPSISSDPTTIAVGPDANMWFTEQATNKIGRITPLGGVPNMRCRMRRRGSWRVQTATYGSRNPARTKSRE